MMLAKLLPLFQSIHDCSHHFNTVIYSRDDSVIYTSLSDRLYTFSCVLMVPVFQLNCIDKF